MSRAPKPTSPHNESLSHANIPLLPNEQAALEQVTRPLQLMRAAAWFLGWRWPAAGRQRLLQQPLPPLDCVRDGCAARVPARAMFGWVAMACQQHAPRCRTPHFPDHALFAVCRRHQPRTLRCTRKTRGDRSPAVCSPSGGAMQGGCAFGKRRCAAEQGCRHRGERRLDPPPAEQAAAAG